MARTYRALLVPTAAIDAGGRAKPEAVFSVTPMAGGSPVAAYGAAQGGSALDASQIKTDTLGNISGLYVADPGPYTLSFVGGGTVVTSAIVDPRDTASPGDVDAAVAGVIGGSSGAGSGISLNPDGSIQDSIGKATPYTPDVGNTYPVFDSGAAVNPPAYPDVFEWDAQQQWFVVKQDGLYLIHGSAAATTYTEQSGAPTSGPNVLPIGWFMNLGANPSYLGDALSVDDTALLRAQGNSATSRVVPLPAGSKVWLGIQRWPSVTDLTLNSVQLTLTQLAIL